MKRHSGHLSLWSAMVFLVLATGASGASMSDVENYDRAPLRGIKSFGLIIEEMDADAQRITGMTRVELQVEAEAALRKARMPLMDEAALMKDPVLPYVYLSTTIAINEDRSTFVYSIDLQFKQRVTLPQNGVTVLAATYSKGRTGQGQMFQARDVLKGELLSVVAQFMEDYTAANAPATASPPPSPPKKTSSPVKLKPLR